MIEYASRDLWNLLLDNGSRWSSPVIARARERQNPMKIESEHISEQKGEKH